MVFFVLSGFFIHLPYAKTLASGSVEWRLDVRGYAARRAHRILPTYFFALLVTLILDLAGHSLAPALYMSKTGISDLDAAFADKTYSRSMVAWALCLMPSTGFGSNGPLWSLGCEIAYYSAYPLWLAFRRKNRTIAYASVFIIGIAAEVLMRPNGITFTGSGVVKMLLRLYPCWIAGAALAEWLCTRERSISRAQPLPIVPISIGLVLYAANPPAAFIPVSTSLIGVGVVLAFATMPEPWMKQALFRFAEFIGQRSYTLYVCHYPMLVLITAVVIQELGARPSHGWPALFGMIGSCAFCLACFWLCERHFIHRKFRLETTQTLRVQSA
jgi:peptidoglycan/LPS O-acetylase OafA/YrhL